MTFVSVSTVAGQKDGDKVTLNCSVVTCGRCRDSVRWKVSSTVVGVALRTSQRGCWSTLSFLESDLDNRAEMSQSLRCVVRDALTGKLHRFSFSDLSTGGTTGWTAGEDTMTSLI